MRILIVTDAWSPQVNGVVTTVRNTVRELQLLRHDVGMITPDGFRTLPCPTYPEIRLAIAPGARVRQDDRGIRARRGAHRDRSAAGHGRPPALHRGRLSVHDRVPHPVPGVHSRAVPPSAGHYVQGDAVVPPARGGRHGSDSRDAPAARSARLRESGALVARPSTTDVFAPAERLPLAGRPIFLYAGRVAGREEHRGLSRARSSGNEMGGRRRTGARRARGAISRRRVHGMKHGLDLAYYYQQADAFVFPSRTDTFGLVLIEAMACGTPVAAYPASGSDRCYPRARRRHTVRGFARGRARCARPRSRGRASLRASILVGGRNAAIRRQPPAIELRNGGLTIERGRRGRDSTGIAAAARTPGAR